jgi:hypothetical protein
MERLGKPRHRREGRRLRELEVSESNLLKLRVLKHVRAQGAPTWIQAVDQCHLLDARPLLQLTFSRYRIANVAIPFIINQFFALVRRRKYAAASLAVLPSSA